MYWRLKALSRIISRLNAGDGGDGPGGADAGDAAAAAGIGAAGTIGGGGLSGEGSIGGAPGTVGADAPGSVGSISDSLGLTTIGQTPGQQAGDIASSLGIGNIGDIAAAADAEAGLADSGRGIQDQLAMAVIDQDTALANEFASKLGFTDLADFNIAKNTGSIPAELNTAMSLMPGFVSPTTAGVMGAGLDAAFGIPSGLASNVAADPGGQAGPAEPSELQQLASTIISENIGTDEKLAPQVDRLAPLSALGSLGTSGLDLSRFLGAPGPGLRGRNV